MRIGIVWITITAIKDAIEAESFEQFYDRVEAFRLQLVHLAQTKPHDNIAVISHGQFLQLFQILHKNLQPITVLMQQFREKILKQPIQNTELFIL
ncbi:Histidine phosphatase superfamily (branch 1) [Acinetobacter boissieri]|uniref:Histidine phosphatase superfamily (Branch 1) n=1 Tax=Acinetobacter boissieri TaxID=1219383 RepID=A0A1G6JAK5_9GAMM|nr:Histidine phosphatase superfamily (branch 1) [Acinetobacter boissieri]